MIKHPIVVDIFCYGPKWWTNQLTNIANMAKKNGDRGVALGEQGQSLGIDELMNKQLLRSPLIVSQFRINGCQQVVLVLQQRIRSGEMVTLMQSTTAFTASYSSFILFLLLMLRPIYRVCLTRNSPNVDKRYCASPLKKSLLVPAIFFDMLFVGLFCSGFNYTVRLKGALSNVR